MSKPELNEGSLKLTDIAKKIVMTGIGSASFAKQVLTNGDFQKEVLAALLNKVEKRKDDVIEALAKEVSKFLEKINVGEELAKALKGLIINVSASVNFEDNNGKGIRPKTKIHRAKASHKKNK